jgi:sulfite reductase (NADPH) hemoprotein beta-component
MRGCRRRALRHHPHAEALTRFLLRHALSATLPRKFKIAFEGCATDHIATGVNDLGFRAVVGRTAAVACVTAAAAPRS